ncbi:glycosyltransferase [uncultured Winogradskyella sp.]|uniref:glycosyltransferase n=1 Tax=uncultured Winogradskyella sp. TaxID=395353 RepID=UPI00261A1DBF|nr:glycosyltransferase [uncultured Winogradskyella sp.]
MKILFINHSAAKTGAPIVLLHFLKWLKQNKDLSFDVLSLQNGSLLEAFSEVSEKHYYKLKKDFVLNKIDRYIKSKQKGSVKGRLLYPQNALKSIAKNNYDLIYANSIISIPAAHFIKKNSGTKAKLLVHIHELNLTINQYCSELNAYEPSIDFTIAVSNKVKQNLITNWGFNDNKIKIVYAHSKVDDLNKKVDKQFIVGGSGVVGWRKGPDFFVLVAQYVFNKFPDLPIKFQWVGKISKLNQFIYNQDIERLGLRDKLKFVGAKDNPHDYFSNFDIFLMTSKEDPFPLVCVEVGMMGKPIICFKDATGTQEVLMPVENAVIPYLDIAKMSEMVVQYFNDKDLRHNDGMKIKQIFLEFTPEKQGAKLYKIIKGLIDAPFN